MADDADVLSQSSLRNAISNAMARIKREFYGKGPSRTRTFICDRIIFSILDDVLTPVEITLKQAGRTALVRRTRLTFEDIMTRTFIGEIERLTGARVLACHSQIVFDPDMAIEIFVLDRPAQRRGFRATPGDVVVPPVPGPQACPPCCGTVSVHSTLGGESQTVTCPWCGGTGRRLVRRGRVAVMR